MTPLARARLVAFGIAGLVFAVDFAVKYWVTYRLGLASLGSVHLLPIFDLRWTENYGVSLGLLTATSSEMRFLLLGFTGLIALGVTAWMWRERAPGDLAGLALVLGGAIGNIHDRLHRGYVIDYADLHFGEWRPFLIFNLADAAITFGVLILLARSLFSRERPQS